MEEDNENTETIEEKPKKGKVYGDPIAECF